MTDNFTGSTDDEWFTASNWSDGLPTSSDDVVMATAQNVILETGSAFAHSLTVNDDYLFITTGGSLTTGAVVVSDDSILNLANGGSLTATSLTIDDAADLIVGNLYGPQPGGTLSGTGVLLNGSQTGLYFNLSDAETFANAISGTGALYLQNGSITLTGVNSYSGDTNVDSGVLQLGNGVLDSSAGSGQVDDYTTLAFDEPDQTTIANVITGTGGVHQMNGIVLLTGANTYSGVTTIDANSALYVGQTGTTGSLGTGKVTDNGLLAFARTDSITVKNAISGTGGLQQEHGTLTLTGANSYSGGTTVVSGTLVAASNGALGTNNGATVVDSGATLSLKGSLSLDEFLTLSGAGVNSGGALRNLSDTNAFNDAITLAANATIDSVSGELAFTGLATEGFTATLAGAGEIAITEAITGTGGLTKTGTGTTSLLGDNTYSGATTIKGGTLEIEFSGTLSNLTGVAVNSGVFDIDGVNAITIGSLSGAGSVELSNGATLTTGDDDASTTFSGVISDGGSGAGLTKNGTGLFELEGLNTYTGVTTVADGELEILSTGASAVTASIASASIVVDSGAALEYSSADTNNDNSSEYAVNATISGAGAVFFAGPTGGQIFLNNAGQYTGGTTIASGIVNIDNNGAFGTNTVTMTGGALRADNQQRTVSNAFDIENTIGIGAATTIKGAVTLLGATTLTGSINDGNDVISGAVNLGGFTLTISDSGPYAEGATWANETLTISGVVSGSGGITQASPGKLVLTGADNYSGVTSVTKGLLFLNAGGSLAGDVSVASAGQFHANGNVSVGSIEGAGKIMVTAGDTLTVGGDGLSTTYSGVLSLLSSSSAFVKTGAGTLTLTGKNKFDGGDDWLEGGAESISSANAVSNSKLVFEGGALEATNSMTLTNNFTVSQNLSGDIGEATGHVLTLTGTWNALAGSTLHFGSASEAGTVALDLSHITEVDPDSLTIDGGTLRIGSYTSTVILGYGGSVDVGTSTTKAELNLQGSDTDLYDLTGDASGVVTSTGAAATLDDYLAANDLFAGVISNGAGLALNLVAFDGGGQLTLTGANTYTGGTTIGASTTLQLGNGGATGTIVDSVTDNGTLTFDWNTSHTFAGAISGSGGVDDMGTGAVTLTAADYYSGVTNVASGADLKLSGAGKLEFSAVSLQANAKFDVSGVSGSLGEVGNISGSGATSLVNLGNSSLYATAATGTVDAKFEAGATSPANRLTFVTTGSNFSLAGSTFANWSASKDTIQIYADGSGETVLGSSQNENFVASSAGGETMTGGGGADSFQFNTPPGADDVITDFSAAQGDTIDLFPGTFPGLPSSGNPTSQEFIVGSSPVGSNAQLLFNPTTSLLSWCPDGTAGSETPLVKLTGVTSLSASSIVMI